MHLLLRIVRSGSNAVAGSDLRLYCVLLDFCCRSEEGMTRASAADVLTRFGRSKQK